MTTDFKYHQYQIVGRHLPTEANPSPSLYRMKVWAVDEVCARSKFWYFIKRLKRVKKANGQIIAVNEIFEKDPTVVKNFGVWLRVLSRTGYYNMFKEFRDVTMNGAIDQMYQDLAARHRIRASCIQIIKTAVLKDEECKRPIVLQFHKEGLSFPIPHKVVRPSEKKYRSTFKASRPNVALF
ncbi:ribosomal protein L18 [Chloropicon primus]|uniref:60S ribosomal protein L18a n=2 Tax=Chloropicon primus TaxID=1764295 RepID=A0A5B8MMH6_9CHLO|nr:ribosomal protein L18 [Chloropicon primus]UPR00968.1 ribosomal protein L18 [Chloropicon primus]|eukprot:QDZ21746.1 ribosomal protein L18 [Chloropicon primus]